MENELTGYFPDVNVQSFPNKKDERKCNTREVHRFNNIYITF